MAKKKKATRRSTSTKGMTGATIRKRRKALRKVVNAMRQTSLANGATTDVPAEMVEAMLKKARLDKRIMKLRSQVLKGLLLVIQNSRLGNIKAGMLPLMPQWIADVKVIVQGCGAKTVRYRVQRLASAMNDGLVRIDATPMRYPDVLWRWIEPLEPLVAMMFDREFERLVRFQNACDLRSAKHRIRFMPAKISEYTNGRV